MSEIEVILVDKKNRGELKIGDETKDFRGDEVTILQIYPPGTSGGGMSGKVLVKDVKGHERLFFVTVINAEFAVRQSHKDSPLRDDERPKLGFDREMAKEKGYDE